MDTSKPRFRWLIGLVIGLLLALFIMPATGWMVRMQWGMQWRRSIVLNGNMKDLGVKEMPFGVTPGDGADAKRALLDAAKGHSDDYRAQLVAARIGGDEAIGWSVAVVARLRELRPRFPDQPALYATILRYETLGHILVHREEANLGQPSKSPLYPAPKPPTPEALAAFDEDAAAGERLDPDNACFPLMRAVGLFAAHRDPEAEEAVLRAASKPAWNDYAAEELAGEQFLVEEAFGDRSALTRTARMAAVLLPHLSCVRAVARMMLYEATQAEKAGDAERGLALRHALMQCGCLMRAQSRYVIGSLVGGAIVRIAVADPGGVLTDPEPSADENARADKRIELYSAYLQRIGHPEEVDWAREQLLAAQRTKTIIQQGLPLSAFAGAPSRSLILWWSADLLILCGGLWLLLTGGLAGLVARNRRKSVGMALLAAAFGLGLLYAMCARQIYHIACFLAVDQVFDNLTSLTGGDATATAYLVSKYLVILGVPIVTLSIVLIAGLVCICRRVPLAAGMMRGLTAAGCLMLLLYGVSVLGTVRPEARVNDGLNRTLQHEGRYLAELTGQRWPE